MLISSMFCFSEEEGLRIMDGLRRKSSAEKSKPRDSLEMVKIIYACLKHRDILLRNHDMAALLRYIY